MLGGAARCSARCALVLTRPQMYGLGYRPAMIQRIALGAKADGTLDAITHEAITVTSQYEDFSPAGNRLVRPALQVARTRTSRTSSPGSICRPRADMRAPSAATGVYALECAMDELAVALKLDPLELRLRCYSDRDQNENQPYSSKAAARMLPPGRGGVRLEQAQPRSRARCATAAIWSAGAWRPASGRRCRCRSRCASC